MSKRGMLITLPVQVMMVVSSRLGMAEIVIHLN